MSTRPKLLINSYEILNATSPLLSVNFQILFYKPTEGFELHKIINVVETQVEDKLVVKVTVALQDSKGKLFEKSISVTFKAPAELSGDRLVIFQKSNIEPENPGERPSLAVRVAFNFVTDLEAPPA